MRLAKSEEVHMMSRLSKLLFSSADGWVEGKPRQVPS